MSLRDRAALWPSVTYALLMGSLALLETSRDATLVAADAVDHLPWVYVGVAIAVVVFELGMRRIAPRISQRRMLGVVVALATIAALASYRALPIHGPGHAAIFYGGIAFGSSVVTSRFWALVSAAWTVEDAKRETSFVSAAGVGGAMLGSWLARAVVDAIDLSGLVAVSGVGLGVSLLTLGRWAPTPVRTAPAPKRPEAVDGRASENERADRASERYLFLLFAFMLIGTVAMTATDFVFKSEVQSHVTRAELGEFFATFYGVAYAIGLFAQLFIARRVVDLAGVSRVLMTHPAMFVVLGALAIGADLDLVTPAIGNWAGAYVAWTVLRGLDAALRYARYANVVEIAHLAATAPVLRRWRTLLDSLSQRAGQAVTAVFLLLLPVAGSFGAQLLAWITSIVWTALAYVVGRRYIDLLRARVGDDGLDLHFDSVTLDLSGVEALLARVSSDDDRRVLGALETLAKHGTPTLVPSVIAYHPSPRISARALDIFSMQRRTDHVHVARRLLDSPHETVRAAAGRAIASAARTPQERAELAAHATHTVRVAAWVALAAAGELDAAHRDELRAMVAGNEELQLALARAAQHRPSAVLVPVLAACVPGASDELARELAFALGVCGTAEAAAPLAALLRHFGARAAVFQAWTQLGTPLATPGFAIFDDLTTPRVVRMQLPKALVLAGGGDAARQLIPRMESERDAGIRYRMLVALGSFRARNPRAPLPTEALRRDLDRTLHRAHRLLRHIESFELLDTTHRLALLRVLIENKHLECVERSFRLVGLLSPGTDYERLYDGLRRGDVDARAAAREVLRYATTAPRANAIAALVGEGSVRSRARAIEDVLHVTPTKPPHDLNELWSRLLAERSETVGAFALASMSDDEVRALRSVIEAIARDALRGGARIQARTRLDRIAS